jgi:D-beta-D-heptose 7-phosphate kinase/D-beta-D-heptose 1-phosphate adenosyltransferase
MGRVVTREEASAERRAARERGKRFVFTNGCFDLVHPGHVEILKAAKALGDVLCVGINSDSSVCRLKGERRPIVGMADRAAVVAALDTVDLVTVFDEDTPAELISLLLPDVLVKGEDYSLDGIVGRADVEKAGGVVVRVPLHGGFSTEKMLRDIARRYRDVVARDMPDG